MTVEEWANIVIKARVKFSNHSDILIGEIGIVKSRIEGGIGVEFTKKFKIQENGVFVDVLETRVIFFETAWIELL